jgi:acetylornithine deacetylase
MSELSTVRDAVSVAIDHAVDALVPSLVAFTQQLVRAASVSGHEAAAQRLMASRYESLGLATEVIASRQEELEGHPAFSDDGIPFVDRLNVIGRWAGTGGGRSLILNGHMDVVPAGDLSTWTRDPWGGEVVGDRLYGRGSCDMKAGLAAAVFAVEALQRAGVQLRGDVWLQSVIGEESGGVGTLTTIVKGYRADACIIMEPMDLNVCPVHAGALSFRLTVRGRGAHASMKPLGVSAMTAMIPLLQALERLNNERHRRFSHPLFADPENIAPISVGVVRSGDWPSSVPDLAVAEGRLGVFPTERADDARHALRCRIEQVAAEDPWLQEHPPELEWIEGQFEPGATPLESPIVQLVAEGHREVVGRRPKFIGIPCGTDLRLFTRHAGIPTVMYGPGSVMQAHSADEFVPLSELVTCTRVLARTIRAWCGT